MQISRPGDSGLDTFAKEKGRFMADLAAILLIF